MVARQSQATRARSAQAALESREVLDEQHAILAGAVVVRDDALDREPERLVERDRALVAGEVTQRTRVRPCAATTAKNRS